MTDTDLARRTCELLGYRYVSDSNQGVRYRWGDYRDQDVSWLSWPDLSAAAREKAMTRGYANLNISGHDDRFSATFIHKTPGHAPYTVTGHGADPYRAICDACCGTQTQDAAREEKGP